MDMEVFGDARARGEALVDADVDALAAEGAFAEVGGEIDEGPELGALLGRVVEQARAGFAEGDEEVTVGVGEAVEEHHAAGGFGVGDGAGPVALGGWRGGVAGADDDMVVVVGGGVEPVFADEAGGSNGLCFGIEGGGAGLFLIGEHLHVAVAPGGVELDGAVFGGVGGGVGVVGHSEDHIPATGRG